MNGIPLWLMLIIIAVVFGGWCLGMVLSRLTAPYFDKREDEEVEAYIEYLKHMARQSEN